MESIRPKNQHHAVNLDCQDQVHESECQGFLPEVNQES
jgi:hypothetical protein